MALVGVEMALTIENILQAKIEITIDAVVSRLGKESDQSTGKEVTHGSHLIGITLSLLIVKHLEV